LKNSPNEPEGYVDADLAFHRALAEATGNPLWPALLNSLNDLLRRYREAGFVGKDGVLFAARQHQKILDAVKSRDAQDAHDAMESHLKKSEQDLKKRAVKAD
jgi:GntR family transcriptional repressor for pyruvate dehydrogenase complex